MLRSLTKTGLAWALRWSRSYRGPMRVDGLGQVPFVVCYHRVVEDFAASSKGYIPAMLISRKMLERQLDWIGSRYRFISLDELGSRLESGEPFHGPVAAVTFDDGYSDVYDNAFPLLKQKGIPAAVFVVTGLMGTSAMQIHDRLHWLFARAFSRNGNGSRDLASLLHSLETALPGFAVANGHPRDPIAAAAAVLRSLPQVEVRQIMEALEARVEVEESALEAHRPLTWEMISEMHRAGIAIGSHTVTHAVLTNEGPGKVRDEIAGSRQEIEHRLGANVNHIAYPDGRFNIATIRAAAASGYRFGYTTCWHRSPGHPFLTIPRKILWEKSCVDAFGRFSGAIMSCHANWIFDFVSKCGQDHGDPPVLLRDPRAVFLTGK